MPDRLAITASDLDSRIRLSRQGLHTLRELRAAQHALRLQQVEHLKQTACGRRRYGRQGGSILHRTRAFTADPRDVAPLSGDERGWGRRLVSTAVTSPGRDSLAGCATPHPNRIIRFRSPLLTAPTHRTSASDGGKVTRSVNQEGVGPPRQGQPARREPLRSF